MHTPVMLLLLLLLLNCSARINGAPSAAPPCSLSKPPCSSAGRVAQHVGDVTDAADLRAALRSCSYDNELILLSATAGHVNDLLQMTDALLSAHGFAHVLVLTDGAGDCDAITAAQPGMCCVWTSEGLPRADELFPGYTAIMHCRLRLVARAVRMKYNVLMLDTDIAVLDNPYPAFAAPPLDDKHLILQANFPGDVNSGVVRVQNAAPSGAVAWLFADAADRQLRTAEGLEFVKARASPRIGKWKNVMWEQANLGDALASAVWRTPVFMETRTFHAGGGGYRRNGAWYGQHAALFASAATAPREQSLPPPPHLARLGAVAGVDVGGVRYGGLPEPTTPGGGGGGGGANNNNNITLTWAPLGVPEFGNGLWQALTGGPPLPPCRGPAAALLRRQLREAAPDAPLWGRDPYVAPSEADGCADDGDGASGAGSGKEEKHEEERVAYAPGGAQAGPASWLIRLHSAAAPPLLAIFAAQAGWSRGEPAPTALFGHFLWYPVPRPVYKPLLRQATGWYNWSRAEQLRAPPLTALRHEGGVARHAAPPLLALSGAALARLPVAQRAEHAAAALAPHMRALAMMGAALGRAVAWPALRCGAYGVDANNNNSTAKSGEYIAFRDAAPASAREFTEAVEGVSSGGGGRQVLCVWIRPLSEMCLTTPPRSITEPELARVLSQLPPEQARPGPRNTLRASRLLPGGDGGGMADDTLPPPPPEVSLAELRGLLSDNGGVDETEPVLFADALVAVLEMRPAAVTMMAARAGTAGGGRRRRRLVSVAVDDEEKEEEAGAACESPTLEALASRAAGRALRIAGDAAAAVDAAVLTFRKFANACQAIRPPRAQQNRGRGG